MRTLASCLTGAVAGLTDGRRWKATSLALLAALLLTTSAYAHGQAQNTGSILGSVTDNSGAVIPNAKLTATDPTAGITRTIQSGKNGDYLLTNLAVGTYILTVEAPGFETYVADSITVDADKSVKIVVKLTIGSEKVTVAVDADSTALDTNSATLGTLIDSKLVEDLPIDGRNVVALAGLLPGVTDLNAPATNTSDRGGPTYSVSGSRNTQNLMLFDGLMWNNLFFNTGINFPPPSALQEVSVLLNNFKAQYGRNAGSVFNVVTKRGTNTIHGSVWDYFQNKYFNAADYLSHVNPKDNSNQFGFNVGGPIIKDKLWYEVTYQQLIQKLEAVGTTPIQGAAERGFLADGVTPRPCTAGGPYPAGTTCASFADDIFSKGVTAGTTTYTKLLNPELITGTSGAAAQPSNAEANFNSAWYQAGNTGTSPCIGLLTQAGNYAATHNYLDGKIEAGYLPNAEVPSACLDPVVARFLKAYVPLENTTIASSTNPSGFIKGNLSRAPQPKNDVNFTTRVDYKLNSRHDIDARFNLIKANDRTAPGVSNAVGIATFEIQSNYATSIFGNIGDTWIVTPNIVNVLRVGYKRYVTSGPPEDPHTWNDFGGNFVEPGMPVLPQLSTSGYYNLGNTNQAAANIVNENIEILEQLGYQRGNHSFQVGVNALRLQFLNSADYAGKLAFSSTYSGNGLADEAMGLLNTVQANSKLVQGGVNHSLFTYIQDDWRATPKLTVNLGVRYELPFQWYQPNGYSSTFIPGHQSTVFPGAIGGLAYPGDPGVLKSLVPTDFNGLVPRVGFAYDVMGNGKLAIRGGFGMFFDAINANVIGVGEPFYFQFFKQLPPGGASVPLATYGTNPADSRPNGNVYTIPGAFDKNNPKFLPPYTLFYPDRNFRTPYYEAFNFGFQLRVTKGGVLDTNYVGKLGRKLTIPYDQNPAISDCTGGYYQSNPALYGTPYCQFLYGTPNGNASSLVSSTQARLRYSPFNYGGGGLVNFDSVGTSNYNGLQMQYTQRGGKLLTILMSYTYSKSIDLQTQSQTTSNSIPNVFDLSSERGVSDYDARHVFNMGWVFTSPRVRTDSRVTNSVLNGWVFGGKFNAHSGKPYNITINNDTALDAEPNQRAAILPGVSPKLPSNRHRKDKIAQWFNVNAFTYPTIGTFSKVQRNSFVGPGYLDTDMNVGRYFPLTRIREGMRLQFRAEAFNVWNTPNLSNPKASFSCSTTSIQQPGNANYGMPCASTQVGGTLSSTFGTIASTTGNNGNISTNGRRMQFAMTVYF